MPASTRSLVWGHRTYWLCQGAGWGLFFLFQVIGLASFQTATGRGMAFNAAVAAGGVVLSHLLRAYFHWRNWHGFSWRRLLWAVPATAFLASIVLNFPLLGVSRAWFSEYVTDEKEFGVLVISLINCTILFGAWSSIYFAYHGYRVLQREQFDRLELEKSAKEAELRALKSQINPHFLFNSLNTLRALIDEDPARAREAVTQLANLLRSSLQAGQCETVPLAQEVQTVSYYLALEQLRHEDRLRVRSSVAPDALALSVPPMLLQTLVENAVKYGISPRPEGGEIEYSARREGDRLMLRVVNPGRLGSAAGPSTGLGLKNAATRLKLLFGERATLVVAESGPERVAAEVAIPIRSGPRSEGAARAVEGPPPTWRFRRLFSQLGARPPPPTAPAQGRT